MTIPGSELLECAYDVRVQSMKPNGLSLHPSSAKASFCALARYVIMSRPQFLLLEGRSLNSVSGVLQGNTYKMLET